MIRLLGPTLRGTLTLMLKAPKTPESPDAADREAHRSRAMAAARAAIKVLAERGVQAELIGSLASPDFDQTSDIDLLVTVCPRSLKYAIESFVEDCLQGLPFDVIYRDELSPDRVARLEEAARVQRAVG
jgi:predicted nucleotidyltransferase